MTIESRRQFLLATGSTVITGLVASHWPAILDAAEHASHAEPASTPLQFLDAAEAADVEAIASQIIPSGATPGAREAHAMWFIDHALTTFFAQRAPAFHAGLTEFRRAYATAHAGGTFATATEAQQLAFLTLNEKTPFFDSLRQLTVLGTLCSPQYGGNHGMAGWKMMGFEDQHIFIPPFGYYDREYTGFVPYTKTAGAA
jgi:hypothetical protein